MSKVVCFIHSASLPLRGTEILEELLETISGSGLLEVVEHVFVNNVGAVIAADKYRDISEKIMITNYSQNTEVFENATLRQLYFFSQWHPDYKILYLHTKGVGYEKTHHFYPGIHDWNRFMLYCLVTKYADCVKFLDQVEVIGVNYRNRKYYVNGNHYSGNFWWAQANYIKNMSVMDLKTKYEAEFWLFRNNPTFINIHTCPYGHYENTYKVDQYRDIVEQNIAGWHEILKGGMKIYYGHESDEKDQYQDITAICEEKLVKDGVLEIPVGDHERNDIFGDPFPQKAKVIKIGTVVSGRKHSWGNVERAALPERVAVVFDYKTAVKMRWFPGGNLSV